MSGDFWGDALRRALHLLPRAPLTVQCPTCGKHVGTRDELVLPKHAYLGRGRERCPDFGRREPPKGGAL